MGLGRRKRRRARGCRGEYVAERLKPGERGACPPARGGRLHVLLELVLPTTRQDFDNEATYVDAPTQVAILKPSRSRWLMPLPR